MKTDNKHNDTEKIQKITEEVLWVMDHIRPHFNPGEIEDRKEPVFDRVCRKIDNGNEVKQVLHKRHLSRISYIAASVLLFTVITSGYLLFRLGHHYGEKQLLSESYEMTAPNGVISRMMLVDGTKVTLNGGTTIHYSTSFTKKRELTLSGEAYFEVAKDKKRPFIVRSKHLSVEVLGTSFGVKTYDNDKESIVTLEKGSVKVNPGQSEKNNGIILKPDQQLIIENATGEFQLRRMEAIEPVAWKDGMIFFRDITLEEIALTLERRFNVNISILSDELKTERYMARFENGESLEMILDLLSEKHAWTYSRQYDSIKITDK